MTVRLRCVWVIRERACNDERYSRDQGQAGLTDVAAPKAALPAPRSRCLAMNTGGIHRLTPIYGGETTVCMNRLSTKSK